MIFTPVSDRGGSGTGDTGTCLRIFAHHGALRARTVTALSCITAVTLLSGCMVDGEPDFGLTPQEPLVLVDQQSNQSEQALAAQAAPDQMATQQLAMAESNQTAVEMTFDEIETQSVPYANADVSDEPEFMLEIAPTSPAPDQVATSPGASPQPVGDTAPLLAPQSASLAPEQPQPIGRAGPLTNLFSRGGRQPRGEIEHLTGGGKAAQPLRGAASSRPRPVVEPAPKRSAKRNGFSLRSIFGRGARKDKPIKVASAAGLARLAPNGLRIQHDGVKTACLKPKLVRLLKRVKRHYGRDVIVTSGYRSAKRNRRVGGARGSRHTTCEAADIQVPGVSKWELAKYLRKMRGRGGVGTYCHTKSVHIDIGTKRDWNWRCRRR